VPARIVEKICSKRTVENIVSCHSKYTPKGNKDESETNEIYPK
jgi:hypothetical protein